MVLDYEMIGKRIRNEREKNNLKQKEIAEELGVSVSFYSSIERGKKQINLTRLIEISNVLNVSIDYILSDNIEEMKENKLNNELRDLWSKCTTRNKNIIYQFAKIIKDL